MEQLDIYPSIWEEDDDAFDYLHGHFQTLTEFFQDVEKHQKGSLIWICWYFECLDLIIIAGMYLETFASYSRYLPRVPQVAGKHEPQLTNTSN